MKVQICEQTYNIAGDLDSDYVEELAQHVVAKMREIARETGTVDTVKVAVLAALSIADELYALRQSREDGRDELRRARRTLLLQLVERALQQSA